MTMLEPEFNTYPDKPTVLISGSYTTVRGAELRLINRILDRQGDDVPYSAFVDRFARYEGGNLNKDHVEDCLEFLQAIDFIEVSPQNLVSRYNNQAFDDLSFEAKLLSHIRRQSGRTRHITYVSEVMARFDRRRMTVERLDEEVQDDDSESYSDVLSWNPPKIRFWANLHDTLGAVSYTSGSKQVEIVSSPTRALLHELLRYYREQTSSQLGAVECLEWVDEFFFPIFADRAGTPRVAVGAADTLASMEADGSISINRESDSQAVVNLPKRKTGTRTISTLSVNEAPESVAYEYPLSRTTGRFNQ